MDQLQIEAMIQSIPQAIRPIYSMSKPNEEVCLYKGAVRVKRGNKEICCDASIIYEWLPSPRITCSITKIAEDKIADLREIIHGINEDSVTIRILDSSRDIRVGYFDYTETNGKEAITKGICLDSIEIGTSKDIKYILFHIVNFIEIHDKWIKSENFQWRGRSHAEFNGWRLTIDEVENFSKVEKTVKNQKGYTISHVARLERVDGALFVPSDVQKVLLCLYWYLSFTRGAWVPSILPVGFDEHDNQVWSEWEAQRATPLTNTYGWLSGMDRVSDNLSQSLQGFWKKWNDSNWNDHTDANSRSSLKIVIHWFISANNEGGSIEGSLILAQAGLELISWVTLHLDKKVFSENEYNELKTAQKKIEKLLSYVGINDDIPSKFKGLKELSQNNKSYNKKDSSKYKKWENGSGAITYFRNMSIHPKKDEQMLMPPESIQVLRLALSYIELSMLYLFDYKGYYVNRTTAEFRGQTDLVPWSKE